MIEKQFLNLTNIEESNMSIKKISAALDVFKQGKAVANPEAWKKGQITVNMLSGFLMAVVALANTFGVSLPITPEIVDQIAYATLGTLAIINPVATVVSTDKVGF